MKHALSIFVFCCYLVSIASNSFAAPATPAPAAADSSSVAHKKGMIVAKSALYGLGGGLVVGLASQAFKSKVKNIFLAGSLGMYAGIILGVVIITSSHSSRYDGPDTYKDDDFQGSIKPREAIQTIGFEAKEKAKLELPLFSANF